MDVFGIYSLFGIGENPELEAFCASGPAYKSICDFYIMPMYDVPYFYRTSMKEFQHVQINSTYGELSPFDFDATDYNLLSISGIPVHAIMSE